MTSPPAPVYGALRVVRGGVLAACSGALAVAAHAAGGGELADGGLWIVPTALLALVAVALAGRRRGWPTILLTLGGAQLAEHLLLSTMSGHHPQATLTMTGAHALAVLLTAGLLSRAEAAVFGVLAALRRALPILLSPPPVAARVVLPRVCTGPAGPVHAVLLGRVLGDRGPPLSS